MSSGGALGVSSSAVPEMMVISFSGSLLRTRRIQPHLGKTGWRTRKHGESNTCADLWAQKYMIWLGLLMESSSSLGAWITSLGFIMRRQATVSDRSQSTTIMFRV